MLRHALFGRSIHHKSVHRSLPWLTLPGALALGILLLGVIGPARAAGGSEGLLPNLVATPPDNASIETSYDEGGLRHENVPAELLLRFNGYVHNDGQGALDFRGSRQAPEINSSAVEKEVENREEELKKAGEEEADGKEPKEPQELSPEAESELAVPAMQVSQRLFKTNVGAPTSKEETKYNEENENYLKRSNEEKPSEAKMLYVNADGHHHWHLQHVAKYSLWNATKTAEVAPAEKVGFCLEDSEHIEDAEHGVPEVGPEGPVYSDEVAPFRHFCQRYLPYATNVYEGISPGWRDDYSSNLGFQWVDISDVLPGEYWLREDVNPEGKILEEGREEKAAYATKPTVVPGFDALPQQVSTYVNEPVTMATSSTRWEEKNNPQPLGEPEYTIVSQPQHGTLQQIGGTDRAIYTPKAGYAGPDSFTFSASDPDSEFPLHPSVATVSIDVGPVPTPSVAISGAPSVMLVGTSVQLSALVTNDSPEVTWSVSAGSITLGGLYTAPSEPPSGGVAVITARSSKGAVASAAIAVQSAPVAVSLPVAGSGTPAGAGSPTSIHPSPVSRPQAMLIGRKLIMTTRASKAGHIRLSAYLGHRLLGTCAAKTLAGRSFTCRLTLGKGISLKARITVIASLRIASKVLSSTRPTAPVPEMKMTSAGKPLTHVLGSKGKLSSWRLLCGPSIM